MSDYARFLSIRAIRQRLALRFSRVQWLLLHSGIFVVLMTGLWFSMTMGPYQLNLFRYYPEAPTLLGLVWSIVLAAHALWTYCRSAARTLQREAAVEAEVRAFADSYGESDSLVDLHRTLSDELASQGQQISALTVFALVNVVAWLATALNMGTSFAFQMTLPIAAVLAGGLNAFFIWQRQRRQGNTAGWFVRFPLRHVIAYGIGIVMLWLLGVTSRINYWDVNTLVEYWTYVLVAHIGFELILRRLWTAFTGFSAHAAKRKPHQRLALGDDGEIEFFDDEADEFSTGLAAGGQ